MSLLQLALTALAGFAAGAVNALAGGGTLISFPVLMAMGIPAVTANATNTVALCPGYLGAVLAQRGDFQGQRSRLKLLLPIAVGGGLLGGVLLLRTGEHAFSELVPWLILLACMLLAAQERLRAVLVARGAANARLGSTPLWLLPLVAVTAVYSGYFGAGVGVMVLAVLGLALPDTLPRLNALKQALALSANGAAAIWFAVSTPVNWRAAAVLAASALLGGACGGRLARQLSPTLLRRAVVLLGIAIAVSYLMRAR